MALFDAFRSGANTASYGSEPISLPILRNASFKFESQVSVAKQPNQSNLHSLTVRTPHLKQIAIPNQLIANSDSRVSAPKNYTPSFISAGQLKNGIKPDLPKTSINRTFFRNKYVPQVGVEDFCINHDPFDEHGDGNIHCSDENEFEPVEDCLFDDDNRCYIDEEDVKAVSISSSVLPGMQSRPSETEISSEKFPTDFDFPAKFQVLFPYPSFNKMQKIVMRELLNTDKHVVICAPTGSGKTVMLEFAMIRSLNKPRFGQKSLILYMCPLKSLCAERVADWKSKLTRLGFVVNELTGDSDLADSSAEQEILKNSDLICTTPEKWDWITRRFQALIARVSLILVDEVHCVGADTRGPTLEAVITRMKMLESRNEAHYCRFVAISATAPNIADIGQWLNQNKSGTKENNVRVFKFDETYRPVPLEKIVIGYSASEKHNAFSFDGMLNYKLPGIIEQYSSGKPTLVFCMSRKSAESSANHVAESIKRVPNQPHHFIEEARKINDQKLRQLVLRGVAYHHAGLAMKDRQLVENFFISGHLPTLFSTSTLAVGVNLPAHLVVVKSTWHCTGPMGSTEEIADADLLQMIGRAGRPQFDTTGRAVVMTRQITKHRYESLLAGTTTIESYMHRRLIEHLNVEMVLGTIGTVSLALDWIKQTFLYVRLPQNKAFYQFENEKQLQNKFLSVDDFLNSLILSALNELRDVGLVTMTPFNDSDAKLRPTSFGRLMARHCIALNTMKMIMEYGRSPDDEFLGALFELASNCAELDDIALRWNERAALNALNKKCKFPIKTNVKTKTAKINVLIQSTLGCLSIEHPALSQDALRIFRVVWRVAACILETTFMKGDQGQASFAIMQNACLFSKIIRCQLWHDSEYISKQLSGVGITISGLLAKAGKVTLDGLAQTRPVELEAICGRHAPFGSEVIRQINCFPRYLVSIEQIDPIADVSAQIHVQVSIANAQNVYKSAFPGINHRCAILIGDSRNSILAHYRVSDKDICSKENATWKVDLTVGNQSTAADQPKSTLAQRSSTSIKIYVRVISLEVVGCDVSAEFEPKFKASKSVRFASDTLAEVPKRENKAKPRNPLPRTSSSASLFDNDCVDSGTPNEEFSALKQFSANLSKKNGGIRFERKPLSVEPDDLPDIDTNISFGKIDEPLFIPNKKAKPSNSKPKVDKKQTKIDNFLVPKLNFSSDESNQAQDALTEFDVHVSEPVWKPPKATGRFNFKEANNKSIITDGNVPPPPKRAQLNMTGVSCYFEDTDDVAMERSSTTLPQKSVETPHIDVEKHRSKLYETPLPSISSGHVPVAPTKMVGDNVKSTQSTPQKSLLKPEKSAIELRKPFDLFDCFNDSLF